MIPFPIFKRVSVLFSTDEMAMINRNTNRDQDWGAKSSVDWLHRAGCKIPANFRGNSSTRLIKPS